MIDWSI